MGCCPCQVQSQILSQVQLPNKSKYPGLDSKETGKEEARYKIEKISLKNTNNNKKETKSKTWVKDFEDIDQVQLEKMSIDSLLQNAQLRHNIKDYNLCEKMYVEALKKLSSQKSKSIQVFQKIAFCNMNLINLVLLTNQKRDIENYAKGALQIYDSNEGIYYQQKIVLLNSISLHFQKNGKLKEAIQAQQQILKLQKMYYPKNDERIWLTSNNIACYYFENGQRKQGNALFNQLLKKAEGNNQIISAIKANHQFYLNKNNSKIQKS